MERVLVVPREEILLPLGPSKDGFRAVTLKPFLAIVDAKGFFAPRAEAEVDPSLKQVIPYGVVVHSDEVFLLTRKCRGGEARLHGKVSLGVGGHVNPEDARERTLSAAVHAAFVRELDEELAIETSHEDEMVGVLNDDSNPVGQVHFGIVYRVSVRVPRVRIKEEENLAGRFVAVETLGGYKDRMETWSRILSEHLWPVDKA